MGAPSLLFLCISWCLLTGFYQKPCPEDAKLVLRPGDLGPLCRDPQPQPCFVLWKTQL